MGGQTGIYYRAISAYAADHGIAGEYFDRFRILLAALDDEYLAFENERERTKAEADKNKRGG